MILNWLFITGILAEETNDPGKSEEDELTEQERFAQEILSLFNYPVYTGNSLNFLNIMYLTKSINFRK
jgi:hypothetical protein